VAVGSHHDRRRVALARQADDRLGDRRIDVLGHGQAVGLEAGLARRPRALLGEPLGALRHRLVDFDRRPHIDRGRREADARGGQLDQLPAEAGLPHHHH
jgi:hypothetical protein